MRIVEGNNVDLISPYPIKELDRAIQWFFQYTSYTGDDNTPRTPEAIKDLLQQVIANNTTYGVIDKNNLSKYNHEAPLVGMLSFAPQSEWNGYLHIAMSRKAWGKKDTVSLAEEAAKLVIQDVWDQYPALLRQSCLMNTKNFPARRLAMRCGFKVDGVFEKFFKAGGKPANAVHLGMLRPEDFIENGTAGDESYIGNRG